MVFWFGADMSFIRKHDAWSEKQRNKWKAFFEKQKAFHEAIKKQAQDILDSENFKSSKDNIQHGNMTVHQHSINVTKYSLALSRKLPFKFNERDLIRGALLHDYFLYDWHKHDPANVHKNLHGFYHPGIALRNAERDFKLTDREREIIRKHMWPLTIVPPTCREAWVVTMADKYCSLMETFKIHKGHGPRKIKVKSDSNYIELR